MPDKTVNAGADPGRGGGGGWVASHPPLVQPRKTHTHTNK